MSFTLNILNKYFTGTAFACLVVLVSVIMVCVF